MDVAAGLSVVICLQQLQGILTAVKVLLAQHISNVQAARLVCTLRRQHSSKACCREPEVAALLLMPTYGY
jgi:hypothetical protein